MFEFPSLNVSLRYILLIVAKPRYSEIAKRNIVSHLWEIFRSPFNCCIVALFSCVFVILCQFFKPFQAWIYHCHLHPLQAANCCRNSRLVVDEDDLMWFEIEENFHVLVSQFHWNFRFKTFGCRKIKCVFRDVNWCFNASWGFKDITSIMKIQEGFERNET